MKLTPATLLLLSLIALPRASYAQVSDPSLNFKAICVGQSSVGFNWENGTWVSTRFIPENWIIQKFEISTNLNDPGFNCSLEVETSDIDLGFRGFRKGCYNIREQGEPFYQFESRICTEKWDTSENPITLETVICKDFLFAPDGWYHAATLHGMLGNTGVELNGKRNYKDSLAISVGKCSVLVE